MRIAKAKSATPQPSESDLSEVPSELDVAGDDPLSSDDDPSDNDGRIPKPAGEPGRPGRGGYNLQDALDWNVKTFNSLKVCSSRWCLFIVME